MPSNQSLIVVRPRVYTCFDASGTKNPAASDLKYYFLLRAWQQSGQLSHAFYDTHELTLDIARTPSKTARLRVELAHRIASSDLLLLILSPRTRANTGWVPWEIDFAVRGCGLDLVCAYAGRDDIDELNGHSAWWPDVLGDLIAAGHTRPSHVPFRARRLAQILTDSVAPGMSSKTLRAS